MNSKRVVRERDSHALVGLLLAARCHVFAQVGFLRRRKERASSGVGKLVANVRELTFCDVGFAAFVCPLSGAAQAGAS